jgi:hypothetical protein
MTRAWRPQDFPVKNSQFGGRLVQDVEASLHAMILTGRKLLGRDHPPGFRRLSRSEISLAVAKAPPKHAAQRRQSRAAVGAASDDGRER